MLDVKLYDPSFKLLAILSFSQSIILLGTYSWRDLILEVHNERVSGNESLGRSGE